MPLDLESVKASDLVQVVDHPLMKLSARSTVYEWLRSGELASIRIGAKWYSTDEAIVDFVAKCSKRSRPNFTRKKLRLEQVKAAEARVATREKKGPTMK